MNLNSGQKTVTIYKNRTFSDSQLIVRWSEPIDAAGYNSAIFGLTVHGMASYSGVNSPAQWPSTAQLLFQHSAVKETANSEAWTSLDYDASAAQLIQNGIIVYKLHDFLPYIRIAYTQTLLAPATTGILNAEISVIGHLFESRDS